MFHTVLQYDLSLLELGEAKPVTAGCTTVQHDDAELARKPIVQSMPQPNTIVD